MPGKREQNTRRAKKLGEKHRQKMFTKKLEHAHWERKKKEGKSLGGKAFGRTAG